MTTPLQFSFLSIRHLFYAVIALLFISLPSALQAQQTNNWYFGSAAGFANTGLRVDFTSGAPVVSTGIPMLTEEGSSSISDASGNPLFYTNGIRIYDASTNTAFGAIMNGGSSSTQSAVIMPKPGNANEWLVFTSGNNGSPGLSYYTVTGTAGVSPFTLSAATNLVAAGAAGEGMSIIGSTKVGSSFWVVVRDVAATGVVRTFDVSNTGVVNATPVTSILSGPSFTNTTYGSTIGSIKSNTCQNKLAFTYLNTDVDLVDFDAATGEVVTNTARRITVASAGGDSGSYGIEFSTNDAYLYITNLAGGNVYRHTIATNTTAAFGGGIAAGNEAGQLQAAPDGKIYMANRNATPATAPNYLASINNPNTAGATFTAQAVLLSGVTSGGNFGFVYRGLPTFPKSLVVSSLDLNPGNGTHCINTSIPLSFLFAGSVNAATISWTATGGGHTFSPGGATSSNASPSITFSTTGVKTVTLTFNDACGRPQTKSMTLTIVNVASTTGTISCSPPSSIILTSPNANAVWYDAASGGNILGIGSPVTLNYGSDATTPSSVWVDVASATPTSTITGTNSLVGPGPSWLNGSSYVYNTRFDVLSDHGKLNSFQLMPRSWPGACPAFINLSFTIEIRNSANTLIYSLPYSAPANTFACDVMITIPVGADLVRGNGYTISLASFSSNASAWEQIYNGFPVTVANVATNNGPSSNYTIMGNLRFTSNNYTIATGCSSRTLVTKACTLPVEWLSVDATRLNEHSILVSWAVAAELNNDRFEIQRSLDGFHFTTIGTEKGRGNASTYKAYNHKDLLAPSGVNVYYRIVQYDFDGKSSASSIVVVSPSGSLENIISIYPNPSSNAFNIDWYAETSAPYQVFDVRGVVVGSGTLEPSKGVQTIGADFISGIYVVKVFAAHQTFNLKLIKQ